MVKRERCQMASDLRFPITNQGPRPGPFGCYRERYSTVVSGNAWVSRERPCDFFEKDEGHFRALDRQCVRIHSTIVHTRITVTAIK